MKNKKVLITGAGGFIGSHLTESLVNHAGSVRALVHYNSRGDQGLLYKLDEEVYQAIEVIASDVRDPASVYNMMKDIDIVFHLAALIGIPYSYYSPDSYVDTNIKGTLNVLNAARELEISKVIHTSTSEVYGTALFTPINEKHSLQAQSPYSATKIGADKIAESYYLSFGLPVVTVRPFNTYGPRQSLRAVIPTIITQALMCDKVRLGNVDTVRDFNYVKDTVQGFLKAASSDNSCGKTINLGTETGVTIYQVVELVGKILEKELIVEQQSERLRPDTSEVYKLICDATLARDLINWQPEYSLEEGLVETIQWFKHNSGHLKDQCRSYNL
jgi:NAD dependent epimerase/dehydratase